MLSFDLNTGIVTKSSLIIESQEAERNVMGLKSDVNELVLDVRLIKNQTPEILENTQKTVSKIDQMFERLKELRQFIRKELNDLGKQVRQSFEVWEKRWPEIQDSLRLFRQKFIEWDRYWTYEIRPAISQILRWARLPFFAGLVDGEVTTLDYIMDALRGFFGTLDDKLDEIAEAVDGLDSDLSTETQVEANIAFALFNCPELTPTPSPSPTPAPNPLDPGIPA